ncbi:hypothetical protein X777_09977 [Ooceraea biroi]|uniref:Uncharacterized protein n=1 Tax=Ooceraea biroi TaxID=2015173 RepID=A0A026W8E7_OOCBI|nr:hypothetical protein X777_09977 [Ooceraea biroi]
MLQSLRRLVKSTQMTASVQSEGHFDKNAFLAFRCVVWNRLRNANWAVKEFRLSECIYVVGIDRIAGASGVD